MGNRAYNRGRQFEYQVKNHLEKRGFFVVRSAGSKGLFDLIAVSKGVVLAIQCKLGANISKQKVEETVATAKKHGMIPVLAYSAKHGRNRKIMFWDITSSVATDDIRLLLNGSGE